MRKAKRLSSVGFELSREAKRRLQWIDWYMANGRNARKTCRHFSMSERYRSKGEVSSRQSSSGSASVVGSDCSYSLHDRRSSTATSSAHSAPTPRSSTKYTTENLSVEPLNRALRHWEEVYNTVRVPRQPFWPVASPGDVTELFAASN